MRWTNCLYSRYQIKHCVFAPGWGHCIVILGKSLTLKVHVSKQYMYMMSSIHAVGYPFNVLSPLHPSREGVDTK